MNLYETLKDLWQRGDLPASSLIEVSDLHKAKDSIYEFFSFVTSKYSTLPAKNNSDIFWINTIQEENLNKTSGRMHEGANNKNQKFDIITVENARKLQEHFHSTPVFSPYKFAVVIPADAMNINASNCLLKILEDSNPNTSILMVTLDSTKLIPTILSRCIRIFTETKNIISTLETKSAFYKIFSPEVRFEDKQKEIDYICSINNESSGFNVYSIMHSAICDIIYINENISKCDDVELNSYKDCFKYRQVSRKKLVTFHEDIKDILNNADQFYLDCRQVIMLIISKFATI